mgnify:FL=1
MSWGNRLFAVCVLLFTSSIGVAAQQPLTLTFRALEPSPVADSVAQILEEAYAELGISLRYVEMPRNRSLTEANVGRIAGEMGRIPNLDEQYPNLIQVPFPLFASELVLVADRRECGLCTLDDVNNLAYVGGVQPSTQLLKQHKFDRPTIQAVDIQQLNLLFINKRVQAIILNIFEAHQLGYHEHPHLVFTPLHPFLGYHYLHQQHADLVPLLNQTLEKMHESGRINDIFRQRNVIFQRRNLFDEPPHFDHISASSGLIEERAEMNGSGTYWAILNAVFKPVTDTLSLTTNSYQRAVVGFTDQRFDILVGVSPTQVIPNSVRSNTHIDYDLPLQLYTLTQEDIDQALAGTLERPICHVGGYNYQSLLPEGLTYYYADTVLDCFAMLDMHRVSAVVSYADTAPDWSESGYFTHQLREAQPLQLVFHNTREGRLLRDWFDQRMRELVTSGEIADIVPAHLLRHSHLVQSLPDAND